MPKAFRYLCFYCAAALALSACATQEPVVQAPQVKPTAPTRPVVKQVPDRPFDADTLYALLVAEIAGSRNRYDIAVSNYVQQALATHDPGVTARAARIARLLKAHDAALEMALLWLKLEPDSSEAHFIAGAELARAGRLLEATEHSVFLLRQEEEGFFDAIAASAAQAGDEATIRQLQQKYAELLQTYPNNASLQLGKSFLLQSTGKLEQALTAARRAMELEPDNEQAGLQGMRLLQAMGREKQARELLAHLAERYPDDQRIRLAYARLLADNDLAAAQQQFEILIKQSPGDPDFTFSLGLIQLERGLLAEAAAQFASLTGGQHDQSAHYYLGLIAQMRGKPDVALHHYRQVNGGSMYLPAVMEAVEILAQMDRLADALQYLQAQQSTASREKHDNLYLIEAELLSGTGDHKAALAILETGLEAFPQSIPLLYGRAILFTRLDKIAQAEQDLKHIIRLSPDNATALNALGYTLANRTERLHEAYNYISAALELAPEDPAILDSMGWVYYRLGNYNDALKYLRQAMNARPDHEIAAHLGEVLWITGAQQEAREVWHTGLQLKPDSAIIQNTLKRLDANLKGQD